MMVFAPRCCIPPCFSNWPSTEDGAGHRGTASAGHPEQGGGGRRLYQETPALPGHLPFIIIVSISVHERKESGYQNVSVYMLLTQKPGT